MSIKRFLLNGYVIAVLATGVILYTLLSLRPLFGSYVPFIPFFLGVILAAWRGGLSAGLVATALSTLASIYFFTEPLYTIVVPLPLDQARVGALLAGGVLCSLVISQLLKAERRAWQEVIQHQVQRLKEAAERQRAEEVLRTERKQAEKVLLHYAAIIESSDDAIIGKTADGIVTSWNRGAERVFGYRSEEASGRPITFLIPEDRVDEERTILDKILHGLSVEHYETVRRRNDGKLIDVSITVSPLRDAEGKIVGTSKIARDITERKVTQHQLQLLTYALDRVDENIFLMGENDPHFLYVNQSAALTLGYSREELTDGMGVFDIDPGWSPEVWTGYWPELCAHRTLTFESEQRTKDGHLFPVEITGNYFEFDGKVYNLALVRDISERKRIETTLRESEALYRSVVTAMAEGVVFQDTSGAITAVNPAAERIAGRSAEQILGKISEDPCWQAVHEDGSPFPAELHPPMVTLRTGEPQSNVVMGIRKPEGTLTWISINSQPLIGIGETKPHAVVTTFHDITERKRAEERLREADRRKNEFLAMLGHELRNPLAPIRNAVQIMRKIDVDDPKLHWVHAVVDRQVTHLTRLVDDLLDVSRIVQGKLTLKKASVDIGTVIDQAIEICRPLIEVRQHTLKVSMPQEPLRVDGDSVRLVQVVSNLLDNAAKFTPEGGRIWLTVAHEHEEAVISIRDTGEGIASALLPYLFDVFTQGERTLDRSQGGLGLGLTIVRTIVELHGGRVEARSEGLGKGSEFIVRLPVLDREPTQHLAAAQ